MAINARGEFAGSVSGGCIEGAVIAEALRVMETGKPKLLKYGIADETAWEVGLSCGGTLDVFVEGVGKDSQSVNWSTGQLGDERTLCAVATVISGAEPLGAKMLIHADGRVEGSLGESALNARVQEDAQARMRAEVSETREYGNTRVFIQIFPLPPQLIIIGGVHTAIPLTRFAKALGFHVIVVDGRGRFATRERFPEADEIIVAWPDEALPKLNVNSSTYVAILTHDPKFDIPALKSLASLNPRYVGSMGSRQTRQQHFEELRRAGVSEEFLASVHGPIGLDLGARTPEEMTLAIMAEMVAVRYGRRGGFLRG
jgi:xanthine dehydrogenase accessory factor